MTIDEYQNNVQLLHKTLADLSSQLEKSYAPKMSFFQNALSILMDSMEQIKEPYTRAVNESNALYENVIAPCSKIGMEIFQQFAASLSSINQSDIAQSIMDIEICDDFVIVPETLIPDTFQYEEVKQKSEKPQTEKSAVKHLSYANALALLAIIIPLICWLITCKREDISSRQEQLRHAEIVAVQNESNQLLEEENKLLQEQIKIEEKRVAFLLAIYQQLQEADSASQDTESCSQYAPLRSEFDALLNPTEADDSENNVAASSNTVQPSKPELP